MAFNSSSKMAMKVILISCLIMAAHLLSEGQARILEEQFKLTNEEHPEGKGNESGAQVEALNKDKAGMNFGDKKDLPTLPNFPFPNFIPGMPLPNQVPNIPQIPGQSPNIPGIPGEIPEIPGIPNMPGIPEIPNIPQIPGIPGIPPQLPAPFGFPNPPPLPFNIPSFPPLPPMNIPGIPFLTSPPA